MRKTAAYAFHHSIPILIGFFPVGIAYGLLMQQAGYNFLWSGACSLFVLAGSLQFLMVTFFAGGVSLATVAVLALGLLVHAGLLALVLLSAIFPKPMSAFGTACIRWLYRRRPFVRRGADPEAAAGKWCAFVAEYHDAFAAGIRHRGKLAGALALALGQCTAYMSVAYCTYRGFGLHGVPFWQVTGTQVLLYIGASCFPMPGASGASEGTFYLAFSPLFGDYLTTAMLIWRLASYYLTIVLGYIAVVAERVTLRRAGT